MRHAFLSRQAAAKLGIPVDRIPGSAPDLALLTYQDGGARRTLVGDADWLRVLLVCVELWPGNGPETVGGDVHFPITVAGWPEDWLDWLVVR